MVSVVQLLLLTPFISSPSSSFQYYTSQILLTRRVPHPSSCLFDSSTRIRPRAPTILAAAPEEQEQQQQQQQEDSSMATPTTPPTSNWLLTLCLPLWLVYVSNQWSRYSISYLVDFSPDADPTQAMNVDVGFNEAQYGLLASVAFTSLFAVASLAAGIASDKYNRKVLTIWAAVSWSAATLTTAYADSYEQVLISRIAMGLACAFSTPTAYTLIKEQVPDNRVALATSIFGTGVAVAGGLASLTILLDNELGWRQALTVVASFGLIAATTCTVLLPNDPKDRVPIETNDKPNVDDATENEKASSILSDVSETVSTARVQWLFLASFLRFCSGLCIGVWSAPYYRMVFSEQQSEYAVAQAAISAVGASVSGLLGGAAADWLTSTAAAKNDLDAVGRRLWVPVVGSLLAVPTYYFAVHSEQSFETAMAWLATEYFVAECWFGPTISTLQATVGPRIGGTAQGLFTLTGAIANLAPSLLGFLYGQASAGGESSAELANLLAAGVCFGYLSSAFCFAMAANSSPPVDESLKKQL